jgi:hypothetical protein
VNPVERFSPELYSLFDFNGGKWDSLSSFSGVTVRHLADYSASSSSMFGKERALRCARTIP